jgi:hypothetical protein
MREREKNALIKEIICILHYENSEVPQV